jgi:hypothetical protein
VVHRALSRLVTLVGSLSLLGAAVAVGSVAPTVQAQTTATCTAAGSTGFTAAMIATSGQTISSVVDATGCNVGIYVGPGVTGVTIDGATVRNANDQGILVQDTTGITIKNSYVHDNDQSVNPAVAEDKAIELVGTSNSTVSNNNVIDNVGSGGIGVSDDGPMNPGAPNPGTPMPADNNTISFNTVSHNGADCGIVLAAYDAGEGLHNNVVNGNVLDSNHAGIVVATDSPNTTVVGTKVTNNTIMNSAIAGIIVHSNAPGDVLDGTVVTGNTLIANGPMPPHTTLPTGIAVVGEVENITNTTVSGNTYVNEYFNLWTLNTVGLTTGGTASATPLVTQVGQTGGLTAAFIVNFTSASPGQGYVFFGTGPGCTGLTMTATQDQGAGTTNHTIVVTGDELGLYNTGLVPGATYWYEVETVSPSGVVSIDNNGGACYSVTIPSTPSTATPSVTNTPQPTPTLVPTETAVVPTDTAAAPTATATTAAS